jgi:hypothetical protein
MLQKIKQLYQRNGIFKRLLIFAGIMLAGKGCVMAFTPTDKTPTHKYGSIGNIKLAVPSIYMAWPYILEYMGESWLDPKTKVKNPTVDTQIDHFSIVVRKSDFTPCCNAANKDAYFVDESKGAPVISDTWMDISAKVFDEALLHDEFRKKYPVRRGVENYIENTTNAKIGFNYGEFTYELQKDKIYGLNYLKPIINLKKYPNKNIRIIHLYYDDAYTTFIKCYENYSDVLKKHMPILCHQTFNVRDLRLGIELTYPFEDIQNWQTYQAKSINLINSFVITNKAFNAIN